ncbi:hypothetical protein [Aliiroseovarius sp. YM-037]|uniref:hypothetical protein n=1 Tax=Aliiroseovarius sp. YM-037 TaxID=3341728 RepID=UPI003A810FB9
MKKLMIVAVLATGMTPVFSPAAEAGAIERACNQSDRRPARALCGCIQDVANTTLTNSEQRTAAGFFRDPHQAQVVRQSDRASDERFWLRYKNFYATAEAYCAR